MTAPPLAARLPLGRPIKVVDVGANPIDGTPPYAPLLQAGLAEVIGFEPNRDAHQKLLEKKGPHETYLPLAVADGTRRTLYHTRAGGMTSLLEPNPDVLALFHGFADWGRVVRTEDIDTVRLDDVPETAGLDLLKIDIQGAELMVFQNAEQRLKDALVIQTEVEFLPVYRDQPLFGDVDQFLRARRFVLHRLDPIISRVIKPLLLGGNAYAPFKQMVWADAIYVRDFTRLDALADDQLLRIAALLHDCYGAVDLALHLLLEHDRRNRAGHGAALFRAITGQK